LRGAAIIVIQRSVRRVFLVLLGGLFGFVVGYFAGVLLACDWLIQTSNLCGIYGVFLTGPIGLVIGIACAWVMSRRAKE
jgi:ABC-type antimicrobial peptide transport system permease subunit